MLVYNIAPSCLFPPVSNRVRLCFFFKLLFVNPFDICLSAEAKDKIKSGGSGLRTLTPSYSSPIETHVSKTSTELHIMIMCKGGEEECYSYLLI